MCNESIGKKLHTHKLYVKIRFMNDDWRNFKKKNEDS
jgi:hypothetical protein